MTGGQKRVYEIWYLTYQDRRATNYCMYGCPDSLSDRRSVE